MDPNEKGEEFKPTPIGRRFATRRYTFLFAGLGILLVLVLISVMSGSDRESSGAGARIDEDFSDPSQTWNPVSDQSVDAAVTDGRYVVAVEAPDYTFVDEAIWSGAGEFDKINASVSVMMTERGPGRFGVICYSNPGTADAPGGEFARYEFFLTSTGGYGIAKWINGSSEIIELKENGPINPTQENTLSVECSGGETAALEMSVNGEDLLDVDDPSGLGPFEGTGVLVATQRKPGLTVAFDDVSAGPAGSD